MDTVLKFLEGCQTFYVATVENDQPKVRPFGAVCQYDGKLYFITNNKKKVYRQMMDNPNVEISGTVGMEWIRLSGKAVFADNRDVKVAMLDKYPSLKSMYSADDEIMAVFYLDEAVANILSVTGKNETINL